MESSSISNNRIGWVDVYKGIMIILVVVGHATGIFNLWIYQFHMAAFFFVSGYLSDLERKNDVSAICKKINTILLPYLCISCISFIINKIIAYCGEYEFLFGTSFIGVKNSIKELFFQGDIYSQYLGTFWFLAALFGTDLLQIIIVRLCNKKIGIPYFGMSTILYIVGYFLALNGIKIHFGFLNFTIIFILQYYYCIGVVIKKIRLSDKFLNNSRVAYILCFFGAIVISKWGIMNGIVVDMASMSVGNGIADLVIALASITIIACLSIFLDGKVNTVGKLFRVLGKNSLGIMIFHFVFFKIGFVILYEANIISAEQVASVVPPNGSSSKIWVSIVIVSIIGSLIVWMGLKHIPYLNVITGQNVKWNNKISKKICNLSKESDLRITQYISKKYVKISETISERKRLIVVGFILIVVVSIPFFRTGIIVNDELQARCLSMQGFFNFYRTNFESYVRDGRLLAAIVNSFTMYVGFIGKGNVLVFKTFQIVTLLVECILFGIFTNKITKNKSIGGMASITAFAFLPVAFEHMSPNAFVTLLGIPFAILIGSLILYINSIENGKKKTLIISMILFFVAQMSYETFVTYTVLYLLIAIGKTGIGNIKHYIKIYLAPIVTAVVYLIIYVLCSYVFASGYSGNQLGFESFSSSLEIIVNLFIACIPGFFVFYPRYQYLRDIYYNLGFNDYVRIFVVVITFAYIFIFLFKNYQKSELDEVGDKRKNIYLIICALLYMILPSLPISVSSMYQGNVGANGFLTLPVTHYEYFAAIFILTYVAWLLGRKIGKKFYVIVVVFFSLLLINVQQMNDIFSKEQGSNYNRLLVIEDFLNTNTVNELNGSEYIATDLYKQQNTLAIHEGYWTTYCYNNLALQLKLTKEETDSSNGYIFFDDDNFVIVNNTEIIVLSLDEETTQKAVQIGENEYLLMDFSAPEREGQYYVYRFSNDGEYFNNPGYRVIEGGYEDGWLQKVSSYIVNTGEGGNIYIQLYNPEEDNKEKIVTVYVDDIKYNEYTFSGNAVEIDLALDSYSNYDIRLECDFEISNKGNDTRELAVVLSDLVVD